MYEPNWVNHDGVRVLHLPFLERFPGIRAYFTGREGGVSPAYPGGLNWSLSVGDSPQHVQENRARSLAVAGLRPEQMAMAGLVHGTDVAVVTGPAPVVEDVDALVTDKQGVALVVTAADCVPVFLVDPERKAIGLVHAGWKGTVAGAGVAALRRMAEAFGTRPETVWSVIGPSIGPCCYEVDAVVTKPLHARFAADAEPLLREGVRPGRWMLDLWAANRLDLASAGVPGQQIQVSGTCTSCQVKALFSHRAEKGTAGRGAAVLAMKESPLG